MQALLLIPIALQFAVGIVVRAMKTDNLKAVKTVSLIATIASSLTVALLMAFCPADTLILVKYSDALYLGLKLDGLGKIFAGMVAFLWPIALCYAFVYMKHENNQKKYYAYYVVSYGVVLGIAFSANMLTMYIFYEMLTLLTLPLITHTQTKEARKAGRYYLYYSLSGSSLALAGIVIIMSLGGAAEFTTGGILTETDTVINLGYLMTFFGFGVKAAIFPLCKWLPMAGAAPTPTTALLHAVAVVKSGAFAIMRMTYYVFSGSLLAGTWPQAVAMVAIAVTIVYGSAMSMKEQHLKRRFAYSTVSNLSYILCGTLLCTNAGLNAALLHFLFHSITKIGIFFAIGAIIETTGAHYAYELNGFGKKMKKTFAMYTVLGLSLIGVPFFAGFVSKYYLIGSSLSNGTWVGYIGAGAIILSAVFTSIYVMTVAFRAFFREPIASCGELYANAREPENGFLIIIGIFAILVVAYGLFATPIVGIVEMLTEGIL